MLSERVKKAFEVINEALDELERVVEEEVDEAYEDGKTDGAEHE